MAQLGEALQEARIRELESRRWTYTRSGKWHSLSRLWRGATLALSDDDLDRLLVRVEARQEDIEADLSDFKANTTPAVPVSGGLSHT